MQFNPAWWLPNGHFQTIFPALFHKTKPLATQRERLSTPDQDFVEIDFYGPAEQPLVLLLHGLTGSSASNYICGLQVALLQHGFSSAALNFRGCSGVSNHTSRGYHSGETADLDFVYQTLIARYPQRPLAVVGFSLGGNMLLKWLGERGAALKLFAAVAVSVPLRLDLCADRLDRGFSKFYRNRLLVELKQYLADKHQQLIALGLVAEAGKISDLGDLADVRSFWQYDTRVVAPLYGFKDAQDYYQQSSSRQFLAAIKTPCLLIQAADDPFMTTAVLPLSSELSETVALELTASGGHVGFVSGANPFKPGYWLEQRIPAYLQAKFTENPIPAAR